MPDLSELLQHWGYVGIFVVVVLGNIGLPVPEESVLVLAGYLVHEGKLRLTLTLAVGVLSAAAGDNAGYWIGRRLGRPAIERYGGRVGITHKRMEKMQRFITRYGALGVLVARFFPGVRVMAGPADPTLYFAGREARTDARRREPMKVAALETYFLSAPLPQPVRTSTSTIARVSEVIVKLTTDAGLVGIGEAHGPV